MQLASCTTGELFAQYFSFFHLFIFSLMGFSPFLLLWSLFNVRISHLSRLCVYLILFFCAFLIRRHQFHGGRGFGPNQLAGRLNVKWFSDCSKCSNWRRESGYSANLFFSSSYASSWWFYLAAESIRLEHVEVPSVVAVGEPAAFLCDVDLEFDNELYSVKWYKDSEEFYEVSSSRRTRIDHKQTRVPFAS